MGYNIRIQKSTAIIIAKNKAEVLQRWKNLNKPENNHLKNGGSWGGGNKQNYWYSWMDENYDQTCNTCEDILEMMGFDYEVNEIGDISITYYDSKTGQEDLFFNEVADLVEGKILFIGEDDAAYKWVFQDGKMEVISLHHDF